MNVVNDSIIASLCLMCVSWCFCRSNEGGCARTVEAVFGCGEPVPGRTLRQVCVDVTREEQGEHGRRRGHYFLSFSNSEKESARDAVDRSPLE